MEVGAEATGQDSNKEDYDNKHSAIISSDAGPSADEGILQGKEDETDRTHKQDLRENEGEQSEVAQPQDKKEGHSKQEEQQQEAPSESESEDESTSEEETTTESESETEEITDSEDVSDEEDTQERMIEELNVAVENATKNTDPDMLMATLKDLKMRGMLTKSTPEYLDAEKLVPLLGQQKLKKLRQTLLEVPVQDLQRAAFEDDTAQVNILIKKHKWYVDRRDQQTNTTPLQWSAINGQNSAADELLRRGADINNKDKFGRTALHYAAFYGSAETAATLLRIPLCNVDMRDKHGSTPLILAAEGGHVDAIQSLLGCGAGINLTNKLGASALHEAAYNGHADAIGTLINSGSNLVIRDHDGNTAMHYAAEQGHSDCVNALLIGKADIRMCNNFEENILHIAAENGHLDVVKTFGIMSPEEENDNSDEATDKASDPELNIQSKDDNTEENNVKAVPSNDSDGVVDEADSSNNSTDVNVQVKLKDHKQGLAQSIVTEKEVNALAIDVSERDINGETPLFKAVDSNQLKAAKTLLIMKADVNASDFYGRTALHRATTKDFFDVAKVLLKADADLSLKTYGGQTAFEVAANVPLVVRLKEVLRKHIRQKKRKKNKLNLLRRKEEIKKKDEDAAAKSKTQVIDEAKHVAKVKAANELAQQVANEEEVHKTLDKDNTSQPIVTSNHE